MLTLVYVCHIGFGAGQNISYMSKCCQTVIALAPPLDFAPFNPD